jgi:DNA helicase-2/ATP-dependent DNA helicase PcrA
MIERFSQCAVEQSAIEVARIVLRESGMLSEFNNDNSVEGKARQENVQELMSGIADFVDVRQEEGNADDKLIDFLSEVSLMSDLDNDDGDEGERITLMTVHSAKGLEFRTVFVVGLEEELFPNQCAQTSLREMEEERRLLYVAITRAKDHCILSFAKSRYKYGSFTFCEPSRFIKEIDTAYMSMQGVVQQRPQQPSASSSFRGSGMFGRTNATGQQQNSFGGGNAYAERRRWENNEVNRAPASGASATGQDGKRVISASSLMQKPANLRRISDVERDFYAPKSNHAALSVGMIVQHDRFGIGEVQSTEGAGENAKATIKFQNAGAKTLLLKFAKLKVIR